MITVPVWLLFFAMVGLFMFVFMSCAVLHMAVKFLFRKLKKTFDKRTTKD